MQCVDDTGESASELRRVQKALKEIEALEVKRDSGERLRKNQMAKIERKKTYRHKLQCLALKPTTCTQGGA